MAILQLGRRRARADHRKPARKPVSTTAITSLIEQLETRRLLSALSAAAQLNLISTTGTTAAPVYHYDITLTNTGFNGIGTFWLGWVPGGDFLPTLPLSTAGPTGWGSGNVVGSGNAFDGASIQWIAAPTNPLPTGHSLSGFAFTSSDSPTTLAGLVHGTGLPILTSFVYSGVPFSDPGFQFTVAKVKTTSPVASKLAIASQPANGTAGKPLTTALKVDVELPSGAIATSDNSSVQLSIASGPGGFAVGSTTSAKAVNGVATFGNLKLNIAGTYTLKATDGTLTNVVTKTITIAPAAPAKVAFAIPPATGTAGKVLTPAVIAKVEDAFGNVEIADASTITLTRAAGPVGGAIAGTLSAKAVNGVATFSTLSMKIAGAYTLKATDGVLAAATKAITISPAAAAKLVITQQPTTAIAGVTLAPALVVKVEDVFGNVATGNSSTVTLSRVLAPTGGALLGTLAVSAVKGIATFSNLSMKIAGAYTIKASDGVLLAATAKPITITNAAAAKLVITQQPTIAKSGVGLAPAIIVKVEDAFGNVAVANASTITLAIATGPAGGTLTGTHSAAAVKGIATFANLAIKTAGTYTLRATDGVLTAAVSKAIVVT
ncbi:MAG TPA: hypothetical protein VH370_10290 [Humisphaera sp.]|jgi:hypothetical protein|nr:hypothetical protein [Humisphaera sp.]